MDIPRGILVQEFELAEPLEILAGIHMCFCAREKAREKEQLLSSKLPAALSVMIFSHISSKDIEYEFQRAIRKRPMIETRTPPWAKE